jgi:hypothetical protein
VRGDAEANASVHVPVAFGAPALLGEAQPLHLLGGALAEQVGREREDGEAALLSGCSRALLVLVCVRVVADRPVPALHEKGKPPQVLLYELGVRPQLVEAPLGVPQGDKLALRLGPPSVQLAQMRPQLLQRHQHFGLLALVGHPQAVGLGQPARPRLDLALRVAKRAAISLSTCCSTCRRITSGIPKHPR